MNTPLSEAQHKAQQAAVREDLMQYVEELASAEAYPPGDAWISLTDAARVTRTSEAMARRWVTSGRLPVKKEAVGIPPRTRLVRISDVAKIRPIVDPTAAITGDVRKLDLPSIPRQQQQIMQDYQRILGETATLQQAVDQFTQETRQTWRVHQQQYQALAHRDAEQQQLIQRVRDSLTESLHALDRSLHQELAGQQEQPHLLLEQVASYGQGLQQARQDLSALIVETEQTLRQALSERVEHSEAALRQALEAVRKIGEGETQQVRQSVADLGAAIWGAHEELQAVVFRLDARTDQQFSQLSNRMEPLETTLGKLQGEIREQGEQVGQQISQLSTQVAGVQSTWQERATTAEAEARQLRRDLDAQGYLQQALQQQLAEERKAREALARQVERVLQRRRPAKGAAESE